MKTKFKEHHIIDFVEQIYKDAIIVLDTNSILNLYRYSEENRGKYFEILKKAKDRLYLTHHICNEFYKNRLTIIENRSSFKDTIKELIEENQNKLLNIINNYSGPDKYNSALSILKHENELKECIVSELETSLKKIDSSIDKFKQDLDFNYVQGKDPILEELVEIINDKVSLELTLEETEAIYKGGIERYEKEIPPGYKDNHKDSIEKFGDLIIWNELQALSVKTSKPILFISDDRKEDWAIKFKGHDLGPRKELIKEFIKNTNNLFYSITTKNFIRLISESYKIKDTETLEEETETIQKNIQQKEIDNTRYNLTRLQIWKNNNIEKQKQLNQTQTPLEEYFNAQKALEKIKRDGISLSQEELESIMNPMGKFINAKESLEKIKKPMDDLSMTQDKMDKIMNPFDKFISAQEKLKGIKNPTDNFANS
ncbi:hypothetical protein ERX46_01700 [Brumimicrobium glaciale]|uniref:PIN like domain-containing protein n=1 Tax=Brumimicrobium glaciale TaxID=200475 RepID=A0A4Q4KUD1_9FLAO|nr:PIN domain-containing protein [Brumimicrobium glaciale]RYM35734.1 hypothetical protein ERX46_01700 [Brumimicrobium glaciale]